ncbi:hypothetical protein R3P38DRAFT_3269820 [Favolaschia claudopus]|uniref:RING-type domain-containing protein n=1 Tax=Favolaschia claudopus TaxID=2862362 RepID=A0AAW0BFW5_9AGAR
MTGTPWFDCRNVPRPSRDPGATHVYWRSSQPIPPPPPPPPVVRRQPPPVPVFTYNPPAQPTPHRAKHWKGAEGSLHHFNDVFMMSMENRDNNAPLASQNAVPHARRSTRIPGHTSRSAHTNDISRARERQESIRPVPDRVVPPPSPPPPPFLPAPVPRRQVPQVPAFIPNPRAEPTPYRTRPRDTSDGTRGDTLIRPMETQGPAALRTDHEITQPEHGRTTRIFDTIPANNSAQVDVVSRARENRVPAPLAETRQPEPRIYNTIPGNSAAPVDEVVRARESQAPVPPADNMQRLGRVPTTIPGCPSILDPHARNIIAEVLSGRQRVIPCQEITRSRTVSAIIGLNSFRLVLERVRQGLLNSALLENLISRETCQEALAMGLQWTGREDLQVEEVYNSVDPFNRRMELWSSSYEPPSLEFLRTLLISLQSFELSHSAVVITSPQQIITCLSVPLTRDQGVFIIFNPHSSEEHSNDAGLILNTSIDATASYLNALLAAEPADETEGRGRRCRGDIFVARHGPPDALPNSAEPNAAANPCPNQGTRSVPSPFSPGPSTVRPTENVSPRSDPPLPAHYAQPIASTSGNPDSSQPTASTSRLPNPSQPIASTSMLQNSSIPAQPSADQLQASSQINPPRYSDATLRQPDPTGPHVSLVPTIVIQAASPIPQATADASQCQVCCNPSPGLISQVSGCSHRICALCLIECLEAHQAYSPPVCSVCVTNGASYPLGVMVFTNLDDLDYPANCCHSEIGEYQFQTAFDLVESIIESSPRGAPDDKPMVAPIPTLREMVTQALGEQTSAPHHRSQPAAGPSRHATAISAAWFNPSNNLEESRLDEAGRTPVGPAEEAQELAAAVGTPMGSPPQETPDAVTCIWCADILQEEEILRISGCPHMFCEFCMHALSVAANNAFTAILRRRLMGWYERRRQREPYPRQIEG